MHEMSLIESLLRILEEQARTRGFSRVRTAWLEIGELSHVDPEALRFCFEALAATSRLTEGARLEIIRVPGRAVCLDCGGEALVATRTGSCPACGGTRLAIAGGDEMRVRELEVD